MGESLPISDSVQTEQDIQQRERYTSIVRLEEVDDTTLFTYQHEQAVNKVEACS